MSQVRIVSDPKVMVGKPVIEGTRITVDLILRKIGAGEPVEQILKEYPHLTRDGVLAAVRFAAESLADITYFPVMKIVA